MKTWIRRTLIGIAATATLLGGLAACSMAATTAAR